MMQNDLIVERRMIHPLTAYLGGVGSWFASMGLQFVMIPTLVIITLGASASALAFVQMALSIPQLFLLIYAGSLADRSNGRTMLIIIHALAALPPVMLGWLVWFDGLQYWHMVIFAISMGLLSAFSMPTRDGLLTRVTQSNVQKAVMMALLTQFGAQLIGFSLAGLAAPLAGPWALLALQCLALLIGLLSALALPSLPPHDHSGDTKTKAETSDTTGTQNDKDWDDKDWNDRGWKAGFEIVARSDKLYPVMLLMVAVGIFFIGIFMVALPLIVLNVFNGGQFEISIVNLCFWGGTITTILLMLVCRPIRQRGKAMGLSLIIGSLILLCVPVAPNFLVLCVLTNFWGLAAGVNMTMSRTIVQIEAPAYAKGRVLSLYNLGFLGAAPLGAMFTGLIAEWLGPQAATAIFATMMLLFTLWLLTCTPVLKIGSHEDED